MIKHFLYIFKNGHYAAEQEYLYESNSKKAAIFAALAKNHRDLKNEYFLCENLLIILLQRTMTKNKLWNSVWFNNFVDPQNGQNWVCPW